MTNQPMYCLFAPDGAAISCAITIDMIKCEGMRPFQELKSEGYQILPVLVTIKPLEP